MRAYLFEFEARPCLIFVRALPQTASHASGGAGFLEKRKADASTFALTVNLNSPKDPEPMLKGLLERMEDKRANDEKAMFEEVCGVCT